MNQIRIGDIYFGTADGEDEALEKDEFFRYFYNYDNVVSKSKQPLKYLILGKKGAGKTLLGEFLNHMNKQENNRFSTIVSFNDFRMHFLRELRAEDTPPNEYIPIWHYIVLIEVSKLLLLNESNKDKSSYQRIHKFIGKNYRKLILTQNAESDIQRLKSSKQIDWISDLLDDENKDLVNDSFISFIPILESLIQELALENSTSSYDLILDKLDDRFVNDALYKNSIISLIKAVDNFNKYNVRHKINIKVTILLRSDIFALLNDTDLNKRESSNAIRLDWGDVAKYESPLFDLVVTKVKASLPHLESKSKAEIIRMLFPDYIKQSNRPISTDKFLLGRTLFRPRDVIKYLSLAQELSPNEPKFTARMILDAQRPYSEYFLGEIQNEMNGHVPEDVINDIIKLMISFSKFDFWYSDIERFETNRKILKSVTLNEALKIMFDFSILGNYTYDSNNKLRHTWKHRHYKVEVDFTKKLCLHYGLWRYFNV